ncbi:winged helix-turn-helix domain-containing protein [Novosphingobium resinovorum]|uniref:winged helix-turn-helix domain-containing protein n=1 Tax=Novosphingobium resinovorum TaxID=158500 RepID=UPI002ED49BC2|nr:winged helix-turn-helix domain-containing protein [Novosphingobium resinovorum]
MADLLTQRDSLYRFRWLGTEKVPAEFDLRASGWALDVAGEPSSSCIGIMPAGRLDAAGWQRVLSVREEVRRFVFVIGACSADERTELLQVGFGEAAAGAIEPGEFEARASRLAELTHWLPRHRRLGELELDLLAREAYVRGTSLNLNPREFALIWRLADSPGAPVSKQELIHDVWRMGFVPETNSIAVHMSRLRRKLGFVGMSGIIATASAGGYCLTASHDTKTRSVGTYASGRLGLDVRQATA